MDLEEHIKFILSATMHQPDANCRTMYKWTYISSETILYIIIQTTEWFDTHIASCSVGAGGEVIGGIQFTCISY